MSCTGARPTLAEGSRFELRVAGASASAVEVEHDRVAVIAVGIVNDADMVIVRAF